MTASPALEAAATAVVRSAAVPFRASPAEAAAVLAETVARIERLFPAVRFGVGCAAQVRQLALPGGVRVTLAVTAVTDPAAHPVAAHTLTLLVTDPGGLDPAGVAELVRVVEAQPFTGLELGELRRQLPLTLGLPRRLGREALAGAAPLLTIHHMTDFLAMVEALGGLGAPAEALTVVDKGYPYRLSARVDAHLRRAGVAVWPWAAMGDALADHADRAARLGRRPLLVDDGGYALPVLLDRHPGLVSRFAGLVEQTMSGIFKLERFAGRLPMPVFSVAESRLKATVECYGIADAAARNILSLLPHEKFEGQAALVIGFGRIGEQIAEVLRARRMRVAVFDRQMVRLVGAHERGFTTAPSLPRLLAAHRPMLVVGSTGRTSVRGEHARALRRDCYLVSVTSRNHEFALDELADEARRIVDVGLLGTRYDLPHGPAVTVLGDGYPINFHHAESLPNKYADLILASLLVGACALARPGHGFTPGHNVARTDQVLETSGLLEGYYRLYGPDRQ